MFQWHPRAFTILYAFLTCQDNSPIAVLHGQNAQLSPRSRLLQPSTWMANLAMLLPGSESINAPDVTSDCLESSTDGSHKVWEMSLLLYIKKVNSVYLLTSAVINISKKGTLSKGRRSLYLWITVQLKRVVNAATFTSFPTSCLVPAPRSGTAFINQILQCITSQDRSLITRP